MLSFKHLSEKKTKIKLNPKKEDVMEGGCGSSMNASSSMPRMAKGGLLTVKKNHGEDCDCKKCEKKRRDEELGDEKDVSTEQKIYDSNEEISEESAESDAQSDNSEENFLTFNQFHEAKYEAGASNYGKMSIRNKRAVGYGGNAAPPEERKKAHDERMKKHKASQMKEGSSYGLYKGSGKPSGQMAAFGKPTKPNPKAKKQRVTNVGLTSEEELKMTRKAYNKLHKDFKSDDPKKPRTTKYVPGKGTVSMPVKFVDEGHYGSDVNKIPKELDKAVAMHKSQAERLRKSPEFKKDAGKIANKIPDQLDKAVAMHTKQAKQLRDAGVGEKNCGCGQTPCKTYGMKKESYLRSFGSYVAEATRLKKEKGYDKGGTKKPTAPKQKDTALDLVKKSITAKYGKGAIMSGGSRQQKKVKGQKDDRGTGKFKKAADAKKQTAADAKKRGFKDSKSYIETMARYGGKKNYDSGRGLGT